MANQRRSGLIQFKIDGTVRDAVGDFTYSPGGVKRETLMGSDGIHGYKETVLPAFIEGVIRDQGDLKLADIIKITEATISLELGNGKLFLLRDGWYAGDPNVSSEEATIPVRFEGKSGKEVTA